MDNDADNKHITPDRWVVVTHTPPPGEGEPYKRVFASWAGSYRYGGSWRMSSGIALEEDRGDYLHFHSPSGTVYRCHKAAFGCTIPGWMALAGLKAQAERAGAKIEVDASYEPPEEEVDEDEDDYGYDT